MDTNNNWLDDSDLTIDELKMVGLAYQDGSISLAGRYVFPIRDLGGHLVQIKGRADPSLGIEPKSCLSE